jgi:hypothetical protein
MKHTLSGQLGIIGVFDFVNSASALDVIDREKPAIRSTELSGEYIR